MARHSEWDKQLFLPHRRHRASFRSRPNRTTPPRRHRVRRGPERLAIGLLRAIRNLPETLSDSSRQRRQLGTRQLGTRQLGTRQLGTRQMGTS